MTVPVSYLINVGIAVSPNAIGTTGFGPLLFATPQFTPAAGMQPIQVFNSMKEVEDMFPTGEIYTAASEYYAQVPKPKTFIVATVGTMGADATAATLTGVAVTLDKLTPITSGSLSFNLNGTKVTSTAVDLSAATDFANACSLIDASLPDGCSITQASGVFTLTTDSKGSKATLSYCDSSPLADALSLTIQGGTLVNGSDGTTIAKYLTDALDTGTFFYFVSVDRQYRDTQVMIDAAKWCESNGLFFGYSSSDADMLVAGADSQAKELVSVKLMRTLMHYSAKDSEYPEISAMGRLSTVNFNQKNSSITLAYKNMPEITVANINTAQLAALQSINTNVFMNAGGVGIYWNGKMADGTWADTVQGVDWLTAQVQNNVFNLFRQTETKVPFTDTGVSMVNQAVGNALKLGVTNGLIGPGYDTEGNFYPKGYLVQSTSIADLIEEKGDRVWQGTSFIAIGTGALQGAVISGTFIQ